jgi:hypothetical protein
MVDKPTKCKTKSKNPIAITYLFGSFFGAFMVASAFAYFNLKFTEYKFINFNKLSFFQDRKLFKPQLDKYILLIYSSKATKDIKPFTKSSLYPIIAIDINQNNIDTNTTFFHPRASIDTILQVIQRFNIYSVPSAFVIRKEKENLYKQNSAIEVLK